MTLSIRALLAISLATLISFSGITQAGEAYNVINQKTAEILPGDNRPEVALFFMYTCPHCHTLENHIDAADWLTNPDAQHALVRVPVQFNGDSYIRLHYALLELGVNEPDITKGLFALGVKQNSREITLKKDTDYTQYAAERFSVNEEALMGAMNSFAVKLKAKQAIRHFIATGATGVPLMTVKGQYLVDGVTAGTQANMITTVKTLLEAP